MGKDKEMFQDFWEAKLDGQFQPCDRYRKRAYICSPLHAEDQHGQEENMRRARKYMLYAHEKMGFLARAPHAYLPMLLCDSIPAERAVALQFGLRLLELSDVLLVCGSVLSGGMKSEIGHAAELGIPITVFHEELYIPVRRLATQAGADKRLVTWDGGHEMLGSRSCASGTV